MGEMGEMKAGGAGGAGVERQIVETRHVASGSTGSRGDKECEIQSPSPSGRGI